MRIAVLTTSYPATREDPSGHFVRAEVHALIEAGHEVSVFRPRTSSGDLETRAALYDLPHFGLFGWPGALERLHQRPWLVAGLVPFALVARRRLTQHGPFDRIVAHWIVPAFWPICRGFEQEAVVVAHGSDVGLLERLPTQLQQRIVGALARPNVTLRCVSTELAERFRRLAGDHCASRCSIVVEPTVLEVPPLPARIELRRQLGLTAQWIVVIVGRAVKDKRMALAVDAAQVAIDAAGLADRASILVIGDGPERAAVMRRFPRVRWLGQLGRTETLRHIRAADLLVSASTHEGAPTAIREARALGTRVVAAKAGDLAEWGATDSELCVIERFSAEPESPTCLLIAQQLTQGNCLRDKLDRRITQDDSSVS
jgi:teichuronic acid biosynthesis glycosyltransferase TuaC